jgi:hypothetical protein
MEKELEQISGIGWQLGAPQVWNLILHCHSTCSFGRLEFQGTSHGDSRGARSRARAIFARGAFASHTSGRQPGDSETRRVNMCRDCRWTAEMNRVFHQINLRSTFFSPFRAIASLLMLSSETLGRGRGVEHWEPNLGHVQRR